MQKCAYNYNGKFSLRCKWHYAFKLCLSRLAGLDVNILNIFLKKIVRKMTKVYFPPKLTDADAGVQECRCMCDVCGNKCVFLGEKYDAFSNSARMSE